MDYLKKEGDNQQSTLQQSACRYFEYYLCKIKTDYNSNIHGHETGSLQMSPLNSDLHTQLKPRAVSVFSHSPLLRHGLG